MCNCVIIPSSRTSIIAILDGGVCASRLEEDDSRITLESSVAVKRGSDAIVWVDILEERSCKIDKRGEVV